MLKRFFHLFKKDFPRFIKNGKENICCKMNLDEPIDKIILQLKEMSIIATYSYITRHTDNNLSEKIKNELVWCL